MADELEILRGLYLKAENDIIAVIKYKQSRGYVDFAETAALKRVQEILQGLVDESWQYVPKMIEKQFYIGKLGYAVSGYANAMTITATESPMVQILTNSLMDDLTEAVINARNHAAGLIIGRKNEDIFRKSMLSGLMESEATGEGLIKAQKVFANKMNEQGVTVFTDKRGRNWRLSAYANMAARATGRQAANAGVLFRDPDWDLYQISSHSPTCAVCAPLQGRVYSRSGDDANFPPLAEAFGKVDKNGESTLENSWLNIHPNCLHVITKWSPAGKTEEEVREVMEFSSFESNPKEVDPRSEAEIKAYRDKQRARAKLMSDYRQYERYRAAIGNDNDFPRTFQTFQKHKLNNTEKYQEWIEQYRKR